MSTVAFIGLGNMGNPMAANLVKAGHVVQGFDLVPENLTVASSNGVAIMANAAATLRDAEAVITMLPAGKHVLSVWSEVVPAMKKGALIIDCSTIDVEAQSRRMRWRLNMASPRSTRRSPAAPSAPRARR